jgi:hypothetical protein
VPSVYSGLEHFTGRARFGRAKKARLFGANKIISPMTVPQGDLGLFFRTGSLRAAYAVYSVKQLKQIFWPGLGPRIFSRQQDLCPARKVRGRAKTQQARAGPTRAQFAQVYYRVPKCTLQMVSRFDVDPFEYT